MHLTSNPVDWYAARAAGIVAYVLLTVVVSIGISLAGRAPGRGRWGRWPMFAVEDVHRAGGLLVGAFIAIHVLTIAIDAFLPFSVGQLVVPLTSTYRPLWVALGIVAAELLIALAITNHYRDRMPRRWWRAAHYANFAVWAAATLHGMGSGTDRSAPWMMAVYAAAVAAVAGAVAWRLAQAGRVRSRLQPLGLLSAGGAALVVLGLLAGPLHTHPKPWNAAAFTDTLAGRIVQQSGATRALVSMAGQGTGLQNVLLRADLLVTSSRLQNTSFRMEFLPSGAVCTGRVSAVRQFGFDARCRMPDGTPRSVHAQWQIKSSARLRGRLNVRSA
ncbi:MAG TPA: ferric reductase-like transmembrane domain-containing protein [Gaiellales bacterium]|jgi:sulfoxide reductase heme-binding subunit YedZ|nr:ferric reductase-like transmembrane domain-containing protein [Gaiellales bacterium]